MLSQLVFSVTWDCPVTCKYCVTESGPYGGPYLDAEFMKAAVADFLNFAPLLSVVFTGGEPLCRRKDVIETIRSVQSQKLWTRVVTNAFWAKSRESATEVLSSLKQAGLSEINFSCDDLHQENISIQNIYNAFWAARDLQLPTLIAHKQVKNGKVTTEFLSEFLGVPLKEHRRGHENPRFDIYSSTTTVPIGYGSSWLPEEDYILYPSSPDPWMAPCCSVLSRVVISPNKELRLCCGMIDQRVPELNLGRYGEKPLPEMICDANSDLIANWLAMEGPYGIMKFIQEHAPEVPFKSAYVNKCHLCNDIFTRPETREVLKMAYKKSTEVSLRRALLEAVRFRVEGCTPAPQVGDATESHSQGETGRHDGTAAVVCG